MICSGRDSLQQNSPSANWPRSTKSTESPRKSQNSNTALLRGKRKNRSATGSLSGPSYCSASKRTRRYSFLTKVWWAQRCAKSESGAEPTPMWERFLCSGCHLKPRPLLLHMTLKADSLHLTYSSSLSTKTVSCSSFSCCAANFTDAKNSFCSLTTPQFTKPGL